MHWHRDSDASSRRDVSQPADPAEQEADHIAREAMRMPDLEVSQVVAMSHSTCAARA